VTLLTYALLAGTSGANTLGVDRLALLSASATGLERLDGPVYVAVLLGSFWLCAGKERRLVIVRRIVIPVIALLVVYHGWRMWYFGDWLNMPFYAKLRYKLSPGGQILIKSPDRSYWQQLVSVYGWPAIAALAGISIYGMWRHRAIRPIIISAAAVLSYASFVGDWMFGLRFFAIVFPLLSIIVAVVVSSVARQRPWVGVTVAAVIVAWCGTRAVAF